MRLNELFEGNKNPTYIRVVIPKVFHQQLSGVFKKFGFVIKTRGPTPDNGWGYIITNSFDKSPEQIEDIIRNALKYQGRLEVSPSTGRL